MSRANLSHAIEDYIKVIYELVEEQGRATTTQIASRIGVKPASVTGMMKRLAANEPPLLEYRKHRGVQLTAAGEKVALEIIRHHRLLEVFLHEILGYSWDEVHAEADRLEHVISEEFEERIAQALGNPQRDPHGAPIPNRDLEIPAMNLTNLSELRAGQEAVVSRVANEDPDLLRYLDGIGLRPDARLTIIDYSQFDGNLSLQIGDGEKTVVLGPNVTKRIYVEVE